MAIPHNSKCADAMTCFASRQFLSSDDTKNPISCFATAAGYRPCQEFFVKMSCKQLRRKKGKQMRA